LENRKFNFYFEPQHCKFTMFYLSHQCQTCQKF
jgi:hypothetical protein